MRITPAPGSAPNGVDFSNSGVTGTLVLVDGDLTFIGDDGTTTKIAES